MALNTPSSEYLTGKIWEMENGCAPLHNTVVHILDSDLLLLPHPALRFGCAYSNVKMEEGTKM